jgi:hypothetical protein
VVPLRSEDALVEMLNSFFAAPDPFTSALGFQRSKRSTCDKVRSRILYIKYSIDQFTSALGFWRPQRRALLISSGHKSAGLARQKSGKKVSSFIKQKVASSSAFFV